MSDELKASEVLDKPAYGKETAQAVLDQIRMHPEEWDQDGWEDISGCGTTRCIAGWTSYIHRGFVFETTACSCGDSLCPEQGKKHPGDFAAKALGMARREASDLFTMFDPEKALHALEYVAKGEKIDWEAVNGREAS